MKGRVSFGHFCCYFLNETSKIFIFHFQGNSRKLPVSSKNDKKNYSFLSKFFNIRVLNSFEFKENLVKI
jgi:hypothetical protein